MVCRNNLGNVWKCRSLLRGYIIDPVPAVCCKRQIWYAIRRVFSIRLDRFPQFFINAAVAADVAFKVLHSISVWLSLGENFRRSFKANEASATYEIYCWRVGDVVTAAPASSVTIGYRECCRLLTAIALNGIIFTVRCFLGWIWKFICFLCILPSSSYLAYSLAFLCSFHFPTFNEPNDRQLFFPTAPSLP